jgi:hypothetical protein
VGRLIKKREMSGKVSSATSSTGSNLGNFSKISLRTGKTTLDLRKKYKKYKIVPVEARWG